MKFFGGLILAIGLVTALLGIIFYLMNMSSVEEIMDTILCYLEEKPTVVILYGIGVTLVGATLLNEWM